MIAGFNDMTTAGDKWAIHALMFRNDADKLGATFV